MDLCNRYDRFEHFERAISLNIARLRLSSCSPNWVAGGKTVLMVTHDEDLARRGNRIVPVAEGRVTQLHQTLKVQNV